LQQTFLLERTFSNSKKANFIGGCVLIQGKIDEARRVAASIEPNLVQAAAKHKDAMTLDNPSPRPSKLTPFSKSISITHLCQSQQQYGTLLLRHFPAVS
jgi:hypothetical protein